GPFAPHAGPVILQFPPMALSARAFSEALDRFLGEVTGLRFAVELRNRELFTPGYLKVLATHGAAHVYNQWTHMPPISWQREHAPLTASSFAVVRLTLPHGARYEERKEALAPFAALKAPDVDMREQVVRLLAEAVALALPIFVLVNNKAEGS